MNDMNTVGFTGPLPEDIAIRVDPGRVTIGGGVTFGCVQVGRISTFMTSQPVNLAGQHRLRPGARRFFFKSGSQLCAERGMQKVAAWLHDCRQPCVLPWCTSSCSWTTLEMLEFWR